MEIEDLKKLMEQQVSTESIRQMFSSKKEAALENFIRATWRGIDKLDEKAAEVICKETCHCLEWWMPADFKQLLSLVYDVNSPDVDKALAIHAMIEKSSGALTGAEPSIHRKGNKAIFVTAQNGCICPFVYFYKVMDPTPNQCSCPQNLFEYYFREYYNLPVKCRVIESRNRGGNCCRYEFEFPKEMIKTPEFKV